MKLSTLCVLLLALAATSCIITVDGAGWHHNFRSESGPRIQGNGIEEQETRSVEAFEHISIEGALDLIARVGTESRAVVVRGDANIVPRVQTRVRGNTLELDLERGSYSMKTPLVVEVSVATLRSLSIEGASNARIEGLAGGSFEIDIEGAGDVDVSGSVERFEVQIEGAGDVQARGLEAQDAEVSIEGAGDVELRAERSIEAKVEGAGDVRYWGNPKVRGVAVHGSGDVLRMGD